MRIVIESSAKTDRDDTQTAVDDSSLETGQRTVSELSSFDLDVGFRLDIKRFPTASGGVGHQLMLVVVEVNPRMKASGIEVRHLIDLGVLKFTIHDPEPDDEVICRVENKKDLWAPTDNVRQVWEALTTEIERYRPLQMGPPAVVAPRPLKFAVAGMKYFNDFVSPVVTKVAPVYFSARDGGVVTGDTFEPLAPPRLFR